MAILSGSEAPGAAEVCAWDNMGCFRSSSPEKGPPRRPRGYTPLPNRYTAQPRPQGEGIRGVWQKIWLPDRTVLLLFGHLPSKAPLAAQPSCALQGDTTAARDSGKALPVMVLQIALLWHSVPLRGTSKTWGELPKRNLHEDTLRLGNQMNQKACRATPNR